MREYWFSLNFDAQCHDSGVPRFIKFKLNQYKGWAFIDFGCCGKYCAEVRCNGNRTGSLPCSI